MGVIYRCEIKQHGYFKTPHCPVCGTNGSACNHRTLIKVIFNPILRLFGREIVSVLDEQDKFVRYEIKTTRPVSA